VDGATGFKTLLMAIARLDHVTAADFLAATPSLATARLTRGEEFFLPERLAQVYEGDTALHAAAFSYDPEMARDLLIAGADIRAKNRRGSRTASCGCDRGPRIGELEPGTSDGDHPLSRRGGR